MLSGSDFLPPQSGRVSELVDILWSDIVASLSERDLGKRAWTFYRRFECIHPFVDGNGRMGRLLFNQLRLLAGERWFVFSSLERESYLATVRDAAKLHERAET